MFELLFKYPPTVFARGHFVLLSGWPVWALPAAVLALAGALFWQVRRRWQRRGVSVSRSRAAAIWALQSCLVALLLLLLWHPAVSIATLKPQQNIVAVLVDDSRSMAIREEGRSRLERAVETLGNGLLERLEQKFQVRLYRFGSNQERIERPAQLTAAGSATRIGDALREVAGEASSLPIGAIVLLSDGADTSGGVDLPTIDELRRHRIPVHAIGYGRERFERDIEIVDAVTPARALPGSRINALVRVRQSGYTRQRARLAVREGGKELARREIVFGEAEQTEPLMFNAGAAGPRNLEFSVETLPQEENLKNNALARLVNVEAVKPRVLYMEGEPRWEFKFVRRAIEEDTGLQLTSILRTTQNKIYRQGVNEPKELEQGFPAAAEELFAFHGLVLGSVEAAYFTPAQQELIRDFADRRGGGILFLGGRAALADGGYTRPPFSDLLPVFLPERKGTFHRDRARAGLARAGRDSIICRLEEHVDRNDERWKKMPELADYQEVGAPKAGAMVLLETQPAGASITPLLVTQHYGRGRTAVFASGGSWRWQMSQPLEDRTHEVFWQQLFRWLVSETPGQVSGSTPQPVLCDESRVPIRVETRDKAYRPVSDARVEARVIGPEGAAQTVELTPQPREPGVYEALWTAPRPGLYLAEIVARRGEEEIGRDALMFRREDGVAEHFRAEHNRELLEKLAEQTGGRYYRPEQAQKLAAEISYSEAGITVREMHDLWNMPFVFLLALALCSAEWILRRKWGVV